MYVVLTSPLAHCKGLGSPSFWIYLVLEMMGYWRSDVSNIFPALLS
jgi:hypothetical protein